MLGSRMQHFPKLLQDYGIAMNFWEVFAIIVA